MLEESPLRVIGGGSGGNDELPIGGLRKQELVRRLRQYRPSRRLAERLVGLLGDWSSNLTPDKLALRLRSAQRLSVLGQEPK